MGNTDQIFNTGAGAKCPYGTSHGMRYQMECPYCVIERLTKELKLVRIVMDEKTKAINGLEKELEIMRLGFRTLKHR